ncbi:MAG: hypothetical protein INR70_08085 [Parafilimonas terrae]|nr:hypothetical protein [Parafilimonas terrae]
MNNKSDPDRMPHPGRTSAERRALDRIGCGEPPRCSPKTLRNMLDAGLIVEAGGQIRRDALGEYKIPNFEMPIPVHMAWCSAVAATDEEMAAMEGLS